MEVLYEVLYDLASCTALWMAWACVSLAVVGYGRAEKIQIQESVKLLLNLKEIPKPDDAADALAIALCHGFSLRFKDQFLMK